MTQHSVTTYMPVVEPRYLSGDVEDVLIRTLGKPKAYNDRL